MATEKGSINDLKLGNDALEGADFDVIPENLGQPFQDPPQPGKYRFRLPTSMSAIWAVVESEKHGTRINAIFDGDAALAIVQSPGQAYDGQEFNYRISNVPRERTKEKILVSDMDLLLRALGETKRPPTNKAYAQALQKYAGKEFGAIVEFSYRCDERREAYFEDGHGGQQRAEGRMGCGERYYQRDVPKVDGPEGQGQLQPVRITCSNPECGASIRAFPNLAGFSK
jgi:hypothetical protein